MYIKTFTRLLTNYQKSKMENKDRKRFIQKINVIRNVPIQEHENADFIAPSEKPYLDEVIDDLSLMFVINYIKNKQTNQ